MSNFTPYFVVQNVSICSFVPGSCAPNSLAGKPSTRSPFARVLLVQLLEPLVLRGEPALGRDVHDEEHLALVVGELLVLTGDRLGGEIVGGGHAPENTPVP